MNENIAVEVSDLLTDDLMVDYLQDNPEFFLRNPELLTSLKLVEQHRGVVSLVERQQQQLRTKIHNLEEEITQLMATAQHNESLFALYNDLYLQLIDTQSLTELLATLHLTTTQLLSLADCKLWLTADYANSPAVKNNPGIVTSNCQEIFDNRLTHEPFYFGRLQQAEQQLLLGESHQGSVVLIRLTHLAKPLGFLAILSDDVEHFDPKMDTLLLGQFRKLVAKLIAKHIDTANS